MSEANERLIEESSNGNMEIVLELLKKGADPNEKDYTNWMTSLMYMTHKGNIKVVRELIKYGADVNAKDDYKLTALIHASIYGHIKIVRELIKSGADPMIKDWKNNTALMHASMNGHSEAVKLLTNYNILVPFMTRSFKGVSKDIVRESKKYI
jgi:ankyrin repeat protein